MKQCCEAGDSKLVKLGEKFEQLGKQFGDLLVSQIRQKNELGGEIEALKMGRGGLYQGDELRDQIMALKTEQDRAQVVSNNQGNYTRRKEMENIQLRKTLEIQKIELKVLESVQQQLGREREKVKQQEKQIKGLNESIQIMGEGKRDWVRRTQVYRDQNDSLEKQCESLQKQCEDKDWEIEILRKKVKIYEQQ